MSDIYGANPEPQAPAAPPPAASPLASPLQTPQIDRAIANVEAANASQAKTFGDQQSALAGPRSKLAASLGQPIPQAPTPQKVADAPKPEDYRANAMLFAGSMAILGAIGSKYGRTSGMASLAAFNGAMKGFQEGNLQAYEQATKQWEENTKKTIENNSSELSKYKTVLENRRMNIDQQMSQIQLISAQYQDKMMFDASAAKNYTMVAQLYMKREEAGQKLAQSLTKGQQLIEAQRQKLEQTGAYWMSPAGVQEMNAVKPDGTPKYDDAQKAGIQKLIDHTMQGKTAGQTSMSPEAIESAAQRYNQTGTLPPAANRGTTGQADRSAILNRAAQLETSPTDQPKRWQQFKSEQKSIDQFMSGRRSDTVRSLGVVVDHLATVKEMAAALKNGDVQAFNRIAQAWAAQTGNPAPTNLATATQIVGPEIIKALGVAGAGTAGERQDAGHAFSQVKAPEQIDGAVHVVQKLMGGQLNGLLRQWDTTTGLPRDKFYALIGPEAKTFLEAAGAPKPDAGAAPRKVSNPAEAQALPPGTRYLTPDGQEFTR